MGFNVNRSGTFQWPVSLQLPKDGGGFQTEVFDAIFRRLPRDEAEKLSAEVATGAVDGIEAVKRILAGWKGVEDNGQPLEFSPGNLEMLLSIQGAAVALFQTWMESVLGSGAAKN